MNHKTKNIIVTITAIATVALLVVLCAGAYFDPVPRSESERRDLAQFPEEITPSGILSKTVMEEFEDYTVDQFPFREFFRCLKAHFQLDVLRLKENNAMAVADGYIAQIQPAFSPDLIDASLDRLVYIQDEYLSESEIYISIVPDKNFYLGRDYGYPAPDYGALRETVRTKMPDAAYIDIFDCLELTDYYRTDTHWRQERLGGVVDKLASAMGISDRLSGKYTEHRLQGFEGVYYRQSALYPEPDTLVYLTSETLDACKVYDYETGKTYGIYNHELFESEDGYDFFLSGTRALLRIDNPKASTEEELIVFRDSFGSSLVPLLAEGYKSIYLVDIRYVDPDYAASLIDFRGKDVLFLYSALILNQNAFK